MPRLGDLHVALGDLDAEPGGDHGEVLLERLVHPGLLATLLWVRHRQVGGRARQLGVELAGEFREQLAAHRQRTLGRDHVGGGEVAGRSRLLDVDHRDHADLEAALGLAQLLDEGIERRLRGTQRLGGREHVEIALGHAHHEVLLGGAILRLGLGDAGIGAAESLPLVPAEHRLAQAGLPLPAIRAHVLVEVDDGQLRRVARGARDGLEKGGAAVPLDGLDRPGHAELWQQRAARLRLGLERREAPLVGFQDERIVARGLLVDLDQVDGVRGRSREDGADGAGDLQGLGSHRDTRRPAPRRIAGCRMAPPARDRWGERMDGKGSSKVATLASGDS